MPRSTDDNPWEDDECHEPPVRDLDDALARIEQRETFLIDDEPIFEEEDE